MYSTVKTLYNSVMSSQFVCSECGFGAQSWYGKCPECGAWNSLKKFDTAESKHKKSVKAEFVSFNDLDAKKSKPHIYKTSIEEFDRVLGGGIVAGGVVLLAGEPGVGKSTLLLAVLEKCKVLYIAGEESPLQVKQRADRIKAALTSFVFTEETQIEGILEGISQTASDFDILVVDSIQMVYCRDIDAASGSVSQIKAVTAKLIEFAKKNNKAVFLVGHITKEGDIAGPKMLEHMVDTVIYFEGAKTSHLRILRTLKNRYGAVDEVGVFEMTGTGLKQITDANAFIDARADSKIGMATVGITEGNRVLFFEIQCLVVPTALAVPRRVVAGYDYNKVQLILAVIRKYVKIPLDKYDIYINVVGGISIKSTDADLGCAAAVISSFKNVAVPKQSVFVGEVGLLGEVRKSYFFEKIKKEAGRYGIKNVYSSSNIDKLAQLLSIFT